MASWCGGNCGPLPVQCWKMMIRTFCRQNNVSQRKRNHCWSLEHQKPMLKTQWGLVQIWVLKTRRIRGTKSKAKQNPLYVKRGRIRPTFSAFLPCERSFARSWLHCRNGETLLPSQSAGPGPHILGRCLQDPMACQGALHPVLKRGLCNQRARIQSPHHLFAVLHRVNFVPSLSFAAKLLHSNMK